MVIMVIIDENPLSPTYHMLHGIKIKLVIWFYSETFTTYNHKNLITLVHLFQSCLYIIFF